MQLFPPLEISNVWVDIIGIIRSRFVHTLSSYYLPLPDQNTLLGRFGPEMVGRLGRNRDSGGVEETTQAAVLVEHKVIAHIRLPCFVISRG